MVNIYYKTKNRFCIEDPYKILIKLVKIFFLNMKLYLFLGNENKY